MNFTYNELGNKLLVKTSIQLLRILSYTKHGHDDLGFNKLIYEFSVPKRGLLDSSNIALGENRPNRKVIAS